MNIADLSEQLAGAQQIAPSLPSPASGGGKGGGAVVAVIGGSGCGNRLELLDRVAR